MSQPGVLVDGSILGLEDSPGNGAAPLLLEREQQVPEAAIGTRRGAFKVTAAGVTWECTRCGTDNILDETFCSVCGSTFADTMRPPEVERVKRDPGMTAIWSMVFPGAGHAYLGMWGQAISRGMISVWVTMTALLTALQAENGLPLVTIVFGLAATALWVVHAHDAYREASGEGGAVLLKGKVFLYVVLGLLTLLIALLVGTALRGGAPSGGSGSVDLGAPGSAAYVSPAS